ncbi:MAG: thiosulfate oxidation carrier protein SoxY [Gallionella sp.]
MNPEMNMERRQVLKTGSGMGLLALFASLGLIQPGTAWAARNEKAFAAKTMNEALDALGVAIPQNSAALQLTVPEIAENGAVVPVTVVSSLARTEQIFIFSDKNPTVLIANFVIPEGTEGFITTRIKMAETANVIALVKAGGKFYRTAKEVKVTIGGCS